VSTAPPGPFRASFWRSPIRGPWLTAIFSVILLVGISILFVTGLLSYAAYNPGLGGFSNDPTPHSGIFRFYLFSWPTSPAWLYRVTQGVHVLLGLTLIPVLLAKLWSVIPKLFKWPPVKSPADVIERVSLILVVGGAIFEFATGILDIQYWYVFPGSFYRLHLYGAWVFVAGFVVHAAIKFPTMVRGLRARRLRTELATDLAHTQPEPTDDGGLAPAAPAAPTMSRRGMLGLVGAGSLTLLTLSVGQVVGTPLRRIAALSPRGQDPGPGPNGFQVNKSAAYVGVHRSDAGPDYRLVLRGSDRPVSLSHGQLLALPQHTSRLPISCVEGWSTDPQAWTGVRLRDLARIAGVRNPASVHVQSLQKHGAFHQARLRRNQILDPDSLLALRVNGADLSLDHGFPARVIVPANPGVHNTKWVNRMTFEA
jgi:DMSO/TMAO reductase YedYZ molybdopterin-dependent catalytic subunit